MKTKKKLSRRTRIIVVISALAVLAVIILVSLVLISAAGKASQNTFQTVAATRGTLQITIASTGTISAQKTVEVGTQVSGTISRLYADFNQYVRKGQVLAELDTTILDLTVQSATADRQKADALYDQALRDYNNSLALHDKGLVSDYDLETSRVSKEAANAARLSADASLQRARVNLGYATIRSPIDGIVIDRAVEAGQTVAASSSVPTLFTIAGDLSQIQIKAYVAESDIGSVKKGQRVTFTVATYTDKVFEGTVDIIHLQSETVQNVVNYVVMVNAKNPESKLMPGMTATVTFIVDERTNALLLPNSALSYKPTEAMMREYFAANPAGNSGPATNGNQRPPRQANNQTRVTAEKPNDANGTNTAAVSTTAPGRTMLWYLDEKNALAAIPVTTGITDGRMTEIISDRVAEGMKFLVPGTGTKSVDTAQNNRNQGPPRFF